MEVPGAIGLNVLPSNSSNFAKAVLLPWRPLLSVYRERKLVLRLATREIQARYRGSVLGLAWSVLTPVIMLAVYTFIFSVVFKAKWSTRQATVAGAGAEDITAYGSFALTLFSGLIIFNLFAECINRAPSLVLAHPAYVKKVVFPLEILPWVAVTGALFNALLSYLILFVAYLATVGLPPLSFYFAPIAFIPVVIISVGLSLILASLGVFIRDIGQIIGVVVTAMLFLAPVFYPITAMPEQFRDYLQLNPLTLPISSFQAALFENGIFTGPQTWQVTAWVLYGVISWLLLCFGYWWFQKTRKGFADVM